MGSLKLKTGEGSPEVSACGEARESIKAMLRSLSRKKRDKGKDPEIIDALLEQVETFREREREVRQKAAEADDARLWTVAQRYDEMVANAILKLHEIDARLATEIERCTILEKRTELERLRAIPVQPEVSDEDNKRYLQMRLVALNGEKPIQDAEVVRE